MFFKESNMTIERVKDITKCKNKKLYKKVKELRDWIVYLDGNQLPEVPETKITAIIEWAQKAMLNPISKHDMENQVYDTNNM